MLLVVLLSLVGYSEVGGDTGRFYTKIPTFVAFRAAPTWLNLLCLRTEPVLGLSLLLQEVEPGAVPLPG